MWQPSLDRARLLERAEVLGKIRSYFSRDKVLEVDVPALARTTVTDPYLRPLETVVGDESLYMQTSPEYYMKRLLAAGSGDIYFLGKAYRADESGRMHSPEFTLLEWYRVGYDDRHLMHDVEALLSFLAPGISVTRCSYQEVFQRYIGLNPHITDVKALAAVAAKRIDYHGDDDKNTFLDVLFSHLVEPQLQAPCIVYDYPASQCALARVEKDQQGVKVARRFEVFWQGRELANAYWELTDVNVQRDRFAADLQRRQASGARLPHVDEKLLAALEHGLPDCAGIALGVDRLLMCLFGRDHIDDVQTFPFASW